jgi:nucleoside-diphosphate-sugar epimerase
MKLLAQEIIQLTNSKSSIKYLPLPSDDPVDREPDISKAISYLDWQPKIHRTEGLKRTIEYFEKLI